MNDVRQYRSNKSWIINEEYANDNCFFYIWYLHTITYPHTKFQAQRTSFDKSWIINEMTVNMSPPIFIAS